MFRSVLFALLLTAGFGGFTFAQPGPMPPAGPVDCDTVMGDFSLGMVTPTTAEMTFAGDLAATTTLNVNGVVEQVGATFTRRLYMVSGTIALASGELNVQGHLMVVSPNAPTPVPMPLTTVFMPPSDLNLARIRLRVVGGTGDFAGAFGRISGGEVSSLSAMIDNDHYRGVICTPVVPPTP
ncbi:MAG: hypothetical protein AB7O52_08070 [Planctomycetota bacterium]